MPKLLFDPLRFIRPTPLATEERHRRIAEKAYLRAQQRNFVPGHELADWLAAEADVDGRVESNAQGRRG